MIDSSKIKVDLCLQIATSLEDVATRLKKIESSVRGQNSVSFGGSAGSNQGSFRRKSSISRLAKSRNQSLAPLASPSPDFEEVVINSEPNNGMSDSDSDGFEETTVKIKRDDTVNPFWIEDRDLKNGKRNFLSGHETQFWKDLIVKYLAPLDKDKEKEQKQARELITLRNQMVFSFFMLNALFVLIVFMLQQEKSTIFIKWPIGKLDLMIFQ